MFYIIDIHGNEGSYQHNLNNLRNYLMKFQINFANVTVREGDMAKPSFLVYDSKDVSKNIETIIAFFDKCKVYQVDKNKLVTVNGIDVIGKMVCFEDGGSSFLELPQRDNKKPIKYSIKSLQ